MPIAREKTKTHGNKRTKKLPAIASPLTIHRLRPIRRPPRPRTMIKKQLRILTGGDLCGIMVHQPIILGRLGMHLDPFTRVKQLMRTLGREANRIVIVMAAAFDRGPACHATGNHPGHGSGGKETR